MAEIQIRYPFNEFLGLLSNIQLNYKYKGNLPEEIKKRLENHRKDSLSIRRGDAKIRDDTSRGSGSLSNPAYRKLNDGVGNSDDTDEEYR